MSRDLRRYARQTNTRLVVGFLLILFLLGDGLIYYIYGKSAAITGLICLLAGLVPLVLIGLVLYLMEWVVKRAENV
jgi:TM2 domain-containing membrane protein YozV